ncbi:MAG: TrbC/VirB2 family protein [Gemmatimonadota bacterium]|nr:TrbC/VirB2 family protein [Deltaproteobacteria bacterium]MDE2973681.1 TrbC/VirB2 family protein [Gemmatimonadota bacterium]
MAHIFTRYRTFFVPLGIIFLSAAEMLLAQGTPPPPTTGTSPWVNVVNELQAQMTGPIARGLSLIAVVIGGLMFAFGEGGSKRALAGILFGLGMAMAAANFVDWLFTP